MSRDQDLRRLQDSMIDEVVHQSLEAGQGWIDKFEAKPFSLLKPRPTPPRDPSTLSAYGILHSPEVLPDILGSISGPCVLDLETVGSGFWADDRAICLIGLAWDNGCIVMPYKDYPEEVRAGIRQWLLDYEPGFIAHNVNFDATQLWVELDKQHVRWLFCTYGLYMQVAGEGFYLQKWGLKEAQIDVLQWTQRGDTELVQWLKDNGYTKPGGGADKSKMGLVPTEILGPYCLLDCESTWLLWDKHLMPVASEFPDLIHYHQEYFLNLAIRLGEQTYHGVSLDVESLRDHSKVLEQEIKEAEIAFRTQPEIAVHINETEAGMREEFLRNEPPKYKKQRTLKEPKKYDRFGKESKSWLKWKEKTENIDPKTLEISKAWENWNRRLEQLDKGELATHRFSLTSPLDLHWLFFDRLRLTPAYYTKPEGGKPSLREDALRSYGIAGKLLINYRTLIKELQYVSSYLDLVDSRGVLHPSWRVPGTVTGRLAGRDPNLSQVPKTAGTLTPFRARPGTAWIDYDLASIEDVVLTELSQDPTLLSIYGADAKPNDGYLFIGAQIPGIREKILETGYDPFNPTKESVARAKKEAKKYRAVAKIVKLAKNYGAGAKKIHRTLALELINLSLQEVFVICDEYERLFPGVQALRDELQREWEMREGYVLSPLGRPLCVYADLTKDLLNRVCQATGHDILLILIRLVTDKLDTLLGRNGWIPIVLDWHDQLIVEVPEDKAVEAEQLVLSCFSELNEILQTTVPIKGTGGIRHNLAECKLE